MQPKIKLGETISSQSSKDHRREKLQILTGAIAMLFIIILCLAWAAVLE